MPNLIKFSKSMIRHVLFLSKSCEEPWKLSRVRSESAMLSLLQELEQLDDYKTQSRSSANHWCEASHRPG